jgi:hypothetical protein
MLVLVLVLVLLVAAMVATGAVVIVRLRRARLEAERVRAVVKAYRRIDAIEAEAVWRMREFGRSRRS